MPFDRDKITQAHIDIVQKKARELGANNSLTDELESQALVVLWDLALAWEEEGGSTFTTYLFNYAKPRLIDWVRKEYGYVTSSRSRFNLGMRSLEQLTENDDRYGEADGTPAWMTDSTPGPEQIVEDREHLDEAMQLIDSLSPIKKDALLRLARGQAMEVLRTQYDCTPQNIAIHRVHAKREVRAALGRDQDQLLTLRSGGPKPGRKTANSNPEPVQADASSTTTEEET